METTLTPALLHALDLLADGKPAATGKGATRVVEYRYDDGDYALINANVAGRLIDMNLAEHDKCPHCGRRDSIRSLIITAAGRQAIS